MADHTADDLKKCQTRLENLRKKLFKKISQLPAESANEIVIEERALKGIAKLQNDRKDANMETLSHVYGSISNNVIRIDKIVPDKNVSIRSVVSFSPSHVEQEIGKYVEFRKSEYGKYCIGTHHTHPAPKQRKQIRKKDGIIITLTMLGDRYVSIIDELNLAYIDKILLEYFKNPPMIEIMSCESKEDGKTRIIPYSVFKLWKSFNYDPDSVPEKVTLRKIDKDYTKN